jgi:hypothetical protein
MQHRAARMLGGWMNVALHETNRAVTKNGSQCGKVDPGLREAGCESVAEVVKNLGEFDPGSCPPHRRLGHALRSLLICAGPDFGAMGKSTWNRLPSA